MKEQIRTMIASDLGSEHKKIIIDFIDSLSSEQAQRIYDHIMQTVNEFSLKATPIVTIEEIGASGQTKELKNITWNVRITNNLLGHTQL